MDKVISAQSYWEWFYNKYPDPELFRSFISSDPTLTKIFHFAAVPDIFTTIDGYPFNEKLAELATISKEDIALLSDLNIRTGCNGDKQEVSEWLDFLDNLFRLVSTTLRYYENGKQQLNLDNGVLKEETIQSFRSRFSICGAGVSEDKNGQRYSWQRTGYFLPDAELFKKEMPGSPPKVICEIHFFIKPTKERVLSIKKIHGAGSIENFLRFRPLTDEICYGGFDPRLDHVPTKSESPKHLIRFFYKGRQLEGREFAEFNYSIRKRYAGKLKKAAGEDKKDKNEEWRDRLSYIEIRLIEAIAQYDRDKKASGSFLRERIQWAGMDYYKTISTEGFDKEFFPEEDDDGNLRFPERKSREKLENSGGNIEDLESRYHPKIEPEVDPKELFDKACRDETDQRIVDILKENDGWKKNNTINYSAIARALDTNDVDIRRRWGKILERAQMEQKRLLNE